MSEYYARHANEYGHVRADEHYIALDYMASLLSQYGLRSVLDVGAGTGRAVEFLLARGFQVTGVEPVAEMIAVAEQKYGIPKGRILEGSGEALSFGDRSFDAVCAFGVMHHVKRHERVLKEMLRVARCAVFISDSNRFGQGSRWARRLKLSAYRMGLWPVLYRLRTGFRGYHQEGGIAYSYSVYDSLGRIDRWSDRTLLIPTEPKRAAPSDPGTLFAPMLTSASILLCGLREDQYVSELQRKAGVR